jgi:alkylated DNA repair dioxygenase AlkB
MRASAMRRGTVEQEDAELPPGVQVLRRWRSAPAAARWYAWCHGDLPWRQEQLRLYGRAHAVPRLTAFVAPAGVRYRYSGIEHEGVGVPPRLARLMHAAGDAVGVPFDSMLATLYRDGRDRVGWHADDEIALGRDPVIAILSLGSPRMLRFRRRTGGASLGVRLQPGDLLCMGPGVQDAWQHALPPCAAAGARISLSLRRLAETSCR